MKFRWLLFALILIGSLRIASTWQHFNATIDETAHLACGMEWWSEHKYTRECYHSPWRLGRTWQERGRTATPTWTKRAARFCMSADIIGET